MNQSKLTMQEARKRIKERDSEMHAFLHVIDDAREGIPIAVKDNIMTLDNATTAGSRLLEQFKSPFEATAVARLKKAGYAVIGKTNLDEFAMGASTEYSAFGASKNPWDKTRVAGGSSGGSAAAVAAGMVEFALGSDTGGSIRQPAAFCGVVGFKPTYGRVSRSGLIAMASSLDQIGPIAHRVEDAAKLYDIIAGPDELDATTLKQVPSKAADALSVSKKLTIGYPENYLAYDGLDDAVRKFFETALEMLKKIGVMVKPVTLRDPLDSLAVYAVAVPVEVASNLARYDGVRYGASKHGEASDLLDGYRATRALFGDEAKRRIIIGTFASREGYQDRYYKKALALRAEVTADFERSFSDVDYLVLPTAPTPAFKIGENDTVAMILADIFTAPANIGNLPAISVPMGIADGPASAPDGLPVGLQIWGKTEDDAGVLSLAHQYEQAVANTEWRKKLWRGPHG